MPDRRHRYLLATVTASLAALAGAAGLASPASAATSKSVLPADINKLPRGGAVEYGAATVKLSSGAASKLKSSGTKLTATGDAKVSGSKLTFQALPDSGPLDVTQMVGAAGVSGGFTAKGSKGSVKVTSIVFQPGGGLTEKNVVAKIGGKLVELGSLTGGTASFKGQADGLLKNAKLSLTSSGAKALNAKTGGGFAKGAFATVELEFTTRELPIKEGVAKLTMSQALLDLLAANGVSLTAVPPATIEGNVVTIQLVAGAFDPENLTGRLQLEGAVTVGKADSKINLFGWRGAIYGKQKQLFAQINESVAVAVADVDVSGLTAGFEGDKFVATGAKLTLSQLAANRIKNQFGVDVGVGTLMGTVDMTGMLSGKG